MPGAARLVVAAAALAALGWAILDSFRFGITDSAVYEAGKEMSTWLASGARPGKDTVGWVQSDLERALELDPANPSLHEMLGRLSLIRARDDQATEQAIGAFTRTLQQRPTSPYSWASLIEALYRKGEVGTHFDQAIQWAAKTGPWEPEVQRTVADYGLAVWSEAKPVTRAAIEQLVANGMRRNADEILQISERRGRLGVACAHLGETSKRTDPKWSQLCQSTGAT